MKKSGFKLKEFSGFGNSPLNQNIFKDKPGYKEKSAKSREKLKSAGKNVSTGISNTASVLSGITSAYGALAAAVPGLLKRGVQYVGGRREWSEEDFDKDFKVTDKLADNANRHMDNADKSKNYNTTDKKKK